MMARFGRTARGVVRRLLARWLEPQGLRIVRCDVVPVVAHGSPDDVDGGLRVDPDRVTDLFRRYRAHPVHCGPATVWALPQEASDVMKDIAPGRVRADIAYVWQGRGADTTALLVAALWARAEDRYGLLDRLEETGDLGAETIEVLGQRWTRDRVDSLLELTFLADELGLERLARATVLDIGAGYGRLVTRFAQAFSEVRPFASDAVPLSTALSEAYVRHRGSSTGTPTSGSRPGARRSRSTTVPGTQRMRAGSRRPPP